MHIVSEPEITVVMAVRNEQRYIEDAITSICAQAGVSFELVVVDDNSTDSTLEIVQRLQQAFQNLRTERNPRSGKVAAFNHGVSLARGKYVCLFAGDDIMPPGSLASRWMVASSNSGERPIVSLFKIRTLCEDPKYHGFVVPRAKGRGNPSGQSPLMNRAAVAKLFPVPETLPNEDTWLEVAFTHLSGLEVRHSDVICCEWRMHGGNSYNLTMPHAMFKKRMEARWKAYAMFYEKFASEMTPPSRRLLERRIRCNLGYESGDVFAVLFSRAKLKDRLRALATINPWFYGIRRRFYGVLSGW